MTGMISLRREAWGP